MDKIAPVESFTPSKKNCRKELWLPNSLLKSIRKQKALYKLSIHPNAKNTDREKYKKYRNTLTKLKRHCKITYYQQKCVEFKSNTRALWKVINNTTKCHCDKTSLIECLNQDDVLHYNPAKIASIFNNHFSTVGKRYANKVKPSNIGADEYLSKICPNPKSMYWNPVTNLEIKIIIHKLSNKRSSGYDHIDNQLLKLLCDELCPSLCILANMSIIEGIFPDAMKMAKVFPLFKSKDKTVTTNYRPISLLLTLSKVLEKVIYKRTYDFLNTSSQIFSSQYGFRTKHSCENAIQELLSEILKGLETGKSTLAVFLDLSKAFDTISHPILFAKLEKYGVRGTCLNWFKSYLSGRSMRVKCSTADGLIYSDYKPIEFGTPQGSVLGPLIFLIFNNDLNLHLQFCHSILFADDTTIYSTHKDMRHLTWCIWEDLKTISDWFKANKLTLNIGKSVCMLFSNKMNNKCPEALSLEGFKLPFVSKTKFLGVIIDDKLSWTPHYQHVVLKIKRNLHLLRQSQNLLSLHAKKVLYYGHIFSHLTYCISTWGPMLQSSQLKKLQKLQNKCINLIDQNKYGIYEKANRNQILTVNELIELELCKIGYKFVNKLLPIKVHEALLTDSRLGSLEKSHEYSTRYKILAKQPLAKNRQYKDSFLCKSMKMFQPLLFITQDCDNIQHFIRKFKNTKFAIGHNINC